MKKIIALLTLASVVAGRKPEAVLEFFGIQPGDVVLEMLAGQNTKVVPTLVPNSGSSTVTPGNLRC